MSTLRAFFDSIKASLAASDSTKFLLATRGSLGEITKEFVGFRHYDAVHLSWLAGLLALLVVSCLIYRRLGERGRRRLRIAFAMAILADELLKWCVLVVGNTVTKNYLPLELCTINVFTIAVHAFRPSKTLDNFLYLVCIPGALAALLFPAWTRLPPSSLMHCHSFSIHILLCCYPVMLLAGRDIRPDVKKLPGVLLLLAAFASLAAIVNALLDTNYMFLSEADDGNPLKWFEVSMGSHLWGFAIILPTLILIFYAPQIISGLRGLIRRRRAR